MIWANGIAVGGLRGHKSRVGQTVSKRRPCPVSRLLRQKPRPERWTVSRRYASGRGPRPENPIDRRVLVAARKTSGCYASARQTRKTITREPKWPPAARRRRHAHPQALVAALASEGVTADLPTAQLLLAELRPPLSGLLAARRPD